MFRSWTGSWQWGHFLGPLMQSAIAWRVLASQSLASRLKRQVRSPPIYFQYGNPPPRWDPPDRVDEFMSGRPPLGCGDLPPPRGLGI